MHLLLLVSIGLVVASVVALAIGYAADGDREGRLRRVCLSLGWASWIVIAGIWASLIYAQPAMCDVLGGDWYAEPEACRHEVGGNGNNNPGNGPWPWT
jgi:hypothetical protein